jgi:DNA-binding MarR family transcriptional regulator
MGIQLKGLQKALRLIRSEAPELPTQQLQALVEIAMDEGLTVKDVEHRTGMTNSSGSRNVRALMQHAGGGSEGYGWVESRVNHQDLRIKQLYLTPKGSQLIGQLSAML